MKLSRVPLKGFDPLSKFMAEIHNKGRRMPFILLPDRYDDWLNIKIDDPDTLRAFADTAPALTAERISG